MTSLVCWAGVDSHGPASIYMSTDSRISWGPTLNWDAGRKVFASRCRPEILGYVGDVMFPSLVLGQIVDAGETRLAVLGQNQAEHRFERIEGLIKGAFKSLPDSAKNPFQIGYAVRTGIGMKAVFRFFSLEWNSRTWVSAEANMPASSDSVAIWGSGTRSMELWKQRWNSSSQRSTSRAIFSSLCDSIASGADPLSGGPPQLVGLYRIGGARTIGVVQQGSAYIFGLPADPVDHGDLGTEWRNHLFERCDITGKALESAQRHHAPGGLAKKH